MNDRAALLIVDDDAHLCQTLSDILEVKGYCPTSFQEGQPAVAWAQQESPIVALVDLRLEDLPGLEVMQGIKTASPHTECIVLTGHASQTSAIEAVNLGAYSYFQKPFSMDQLLLTIQRAVEKYEASRALFESEALFRSFFENASVAVTLVDLDGRVIETNDANCQFLGYSRSELIGVHISQFIHPQDLALDENLRQSMMAGQRPGFDLQRRYVRKDGKVVWGHLALSLIRDSQGLPLYTSAICNDITVRKQAEEEARRHAARLEALRQVSLNLTAELDLDTLLRSIIERAVDLVDGCGGTFEAYHPESDALFTEAVVGIGPKITDEPLHRGLGLAGRVWAEGRPIIVDDYQSWEGQVEGSDDLPVRGTIGIPVRWGHQFLGVINIMSQAAGAFSTADAELLELFAAQAAVAIHNAHMYDETQRRNRELIILNRVVAATAAAIGEGFGPLLEGICRELADFFHAPVAVAALYDEAGTQATVVAEYQAPGRPSVLGASLPAAGNPLDEYLRTRREPLIMSSSERESVVGNAEPSVAGPLAEILHDQEVTSMLLLPLLIEGELAGTLGVGSCKARTFDAHAVELAGHIAEQVSGALARARLAEEQRRLSAALEQTADSVIITDTKGSITYVNPSFERTSGYHRAEVLGKNPRILKSGRQDGAFYRQLWQTISAGAVWRGRLVNRRKEGSLYTLDAIITPLRKPDGEIVNYVATRRDVTRELQLEEQFLQAQKMEAVGRLAGGVAHDFNNLLTIIHLSTRMLERSLRVEDPLRTHVDRIREAGQRAANLTKQLLAFSRREIAEPKVLNLNQILKDLDKMLRRLIGEDVEMILRPDDDLWSVRMDPTQVEQIVVNLAVNARDAMPTGGKLTIETSNLVLDEAYTARHLDMAPGEYVLLAISDTGGGMSEEIQAHIFEPFFTTKEKGKGTGLGLATVFGIVNQNQGYIKVYSEVMQGTSFKILLPRMDDGAPIVAHPPLAIAARGTETLLLVEDEANLRELTRDILLDQGYQVLTAADGVEGIQIARTYGGPIHLLITDVIMPRMSGKTLADNLTALRPEIRVLFTSGYTDNAIVHHGVLDEGVNFLSKPFELEALARTVRDVLDAAP